MISNGNVDNYIVIIDLIELYNFYIQIVLSNIIWKFYEFICMSAIFIDGPLKQPLLKKYL